MPTLMRCALIALCLNAPFAHAFTTPDAPEASTGRYTLSSAQSQTGMVVTANQHASSAAQLMLQKGGSAIDAAIAAQAVLSLVEPQSSGLSGGAFLVYHDGKRTLSINGRETAPAQLHKNSFLNQAGKPRGFDDVITSGLAVGTPGVLAALEAAHKRYGKLAWSDLFAPAIKLADDGFAISPRLHGLISSDRLLSKQPSTRAYFFDDAGLPLPVGFTLKNPEYAQTLRLIAKDGANAFYSGPIALSLVRAVQAQGGVLTLADLKRYKPLITPAFCQPYKIYRICSAPPPAGGWSVIQALKIIEPFAQPNLHQLMEAERLAFADRQRYSADSAFIPVPLKGLFSADYLDERRRLIGETRIPEVHAGVPKGLKKPWAQDGQLLERGTTQISIVDAQGHWLSMTSSIEDAFGSRLMVSGMLLNNQMTDFSFAPIQDGHPVANTIAPNKRPRSAMSPTLVLKNGQPFLNIGSPGGSRIIGFVTQALYSSLELNQMPAQVVQNSHRLSRTGAVEAESDGADIELLRKRGHPVQIGEINSGLSVIRQEGTTLYGAADPRREGKAIGL